MYAHIYRGCVYVPCALIRTFSESAVVRSCADGVGCVGVVLVVVVAIPFNSAVVVVVVVVVLSLSRVVLP
eukprot:12911381-Prorocentrum_lima.AAC.1